MALARIASKRLATSLRQGVAVRSISAAAYSLPLQREKVAFASFAAPARFFSAAPEKHEFQAETRKLLDIVTHSIYTDKEVFLRELVSNASDALEKLRYYQVNGQSIAPSDAPLQISIGLDKENKVITISDNGTGMSKEDMISHLGTIARSGSRQFVEQLKNSGSQRDGESIIGQFGVGFYSAFMVADSVTVESLAATANPGEGYAWTSDGSGEFTVTPCPHATRGCKIILKLKAECGDYCNASKLKEIVKKYSNFVSFPIVVDDVTVNTVSAIWTQDPKSVTEDQYSEFYKYVANAFDKPKFRMHFRADAPIDLKALLFFPTLHTEKFGMGRMEPAVNLYSRKVLIENKPKDLLPQWLRFMKGVVDSEDLPLSIAREKAQDSMLLTKIRDVLTRKIIRFLEDKSKSSPKDYEDFYKEFHFFIKEGICSDATYQDSLSKLLRFESSTLNPTELTTFDEYIARCPPEQKEIYYLVAPSRSAAESSPYFETFRKHKREVLFLYTTIDDFVMSNLKSIGGRQLISAEHSSIKFDDVKQDDAKKDGEEKAAEATAELSSEQANMLCAWMKLSLGPRVKEVQITNRLSSSPCIVTDHESGTMRRMMKMVDQANQQAASDLPPQVLQVNPSHPIILNLAKLKDTDEDVAKMVAEQLMDNALVTAGLIDDVRTMVPRLNELLQKIVSK